MFCISVQSSNKGTCRITGFFGALWQSGLGLYACCQRFRLLFHSSISKSQLNQSRFKALFEPKKMPTKGEVDLQPQPGLLPTITNHYLHAPQTLIQLKEGTSYPGVSNLFEQTGVESPVQTGVE